MAKGPFKMKGFPAHAGVSPAKGKYPERPQMVDKDKDKIPDYIQRPEEEKHFDENGELITQDTAKGKVNQAKKGLQKGLQNVRSEVEVTPKDVADPVKKDPVEKETTDWLNIRSYLKGEQGLIPDWKGKSTASTATDLSKKVQGGWKGLKKGGWFKKIIKK